MERCNPTRRCNKQGWRNKYVGGKLAVSDCIKNVLKKIDICQHLALKLIFLAKKLLNFKISNPWNCLRLNCPKIKPVRMIALLYTQKHRLKECCSLQLLAVATVRITAKGGIIKTSLRSCPTVPFKSKLTVHCDSRLLHKSRIENKLSRIERWLIKKNPQLVLF